MSKKMNMEQLQELYGKGENIMQFLRMGSGFENNELRSIEISYDLQTGSYIDVLKNKEVYDTKLKYSEALASVIDHLDIDSIMEAGVGEATTLAHTLSFLKNKPENVFGFDLSWSRIKYAQRYLQENSPQSGNKQCLFTSDLCSIAAPDNSFDLVFTSHAVEPNRGREKEIIAELARVSNKYVLLLEPSSEFGSNDTKEHIDQHRYCRNLRGVAEELGLKVLEHRLFEYCANKVNQTELLLIQVETADEKYNNKSALGCPICKRELIHSKEHYYCDHDKAVFPVIDGIPCLRAEQSIIASKYLED